MLAAVNWIELGLEAVKHDDPLIAVEQASGQGGSTLVVMLLFALVVIGTKMLSIQRHNARQLKALRKSLSQFACDDAGSVPVRRVEQQSVQTTGTPHRQVEGTEQVHIIKIIPMVMSEGDERLVAEK
jgi:hypothetical protein